MATSVGYIEGFLDGGVYYTGAAFGADGVLEFSATAPAPSRGLSLANDLAQQHNLPTNSVYAEAFLTFAGTDYGDTGGTNAVAASGVLTASGQPSAGQTVTIGTGNSARVYTWRSGSVPAPYDVLIGASAQASLANLRDAIMRGATEGTDYGLYTVAHPEVTAVSDATTCTVTARVPGAAGNAQATTETSSNMSWGAATLASGADAIPS